MKYYLTEAGKDLIRNPRDTGSGRKAILALKHQKYGKQAAEVVAARERGERHSMDPGKYVDVSQAAGEHKSGRGKVTFKRV